MHCNCESLVCNMPHADGSRDTLDTRAWKPCSNDALDDFRVLYIGPVCEGCYKSYPVEYRMARNPDDEPEWADDFHKANDLYLFIENTGELYEAKKFIQADSRVYDARIAPFVWMPWVTLGAAMYVYEIIEGHELSSFGRHAPSLKKVEHYFPMHVREMVAHRVAEHERNRLINEQDYAPPLRRGSGSDKRNPRRVIHRKGGVLQLTPDCADRELQRIVGPQRAGSPLGSAVPWGLGKTRIWYMRPEFFRDGIMGVGWLEKRSLMPDPMALEKTHVCIGRVNETDLSSVFAMMQGESWSPNGEARSFIQARGLQHTSMSVGDVIQKGARAFIVDQAGFVKLT